MFYFLSKIIYLLLSPLVWGMVLIAAGIFFSKTPRNKKLLISGFVILYLFSNTFLFQLVIKPWEESEKSESVKNVQTAVVLGGAAEWDISDSRIVFGEASDRYLKAIQLLHEKKINRIVFSGGTNREKNRYPEAKILKDFSVLTGIPDSLLLVEDRSFNTHENALYSSELFEANNLAKKIVLITSAFHIRRAKKCFEKHGFEVITFPAHSLKASNALKPADYWVPKAEVLYNWNLLLKEWLGFVVYWIAGYI